MKWAEKQRGWAYRQVRLVHAVAAAALASSDDPAKALDTITEIAAFNGLEPAMNETLEAWEREYLTGGTA